MRFELRLTHLPTNPMDNLVFVSEEFHVAVCKACESGVWGDVKRHFADHHKETWKKHQKELKSHIGGRDFADREYVLANSLEAWETREAVHGIAVLDGWCCEVENCSYLSISEQGWPNPVRSWFGSVLWLGPTCFRDGLGQD
jgi:Orsellinic acid/F9775 biosynthesis cluster protein D